MVAELCRHGYTLSPGTLYPVLRPLTGAGHLAKQERRGSVGFVPGVRRRATQREAVS